MDNGETEKDQDGWDEYVRRANELINSRNLDRWEIDYKRRLARVLEEARQELYSNSGRWASLVERGLSSNLTFYTLKLQVTEWIADFPEDASEALKAIWTEDHLSPGQRISTFCGQFPSDVVGKGVGSRLNVASVLLMGLDVECYPPFRIKVFKELCTRTGYDSPQKGADEATLYEHFLGFLTSLLNNLGHMECNCDTALTRREWPGNSSMIYPN